MNLYYCYYPHVSKEKTMVKWFDHNQVTSNRSAGIHVYLKFKICAPRLYCLSNIKSVQFSSVAQSCPTLCDTMNCSMPGLPVHQQLPEFTQTHVHWVSDSIQPSHPLLSPSPPACNLSQHQGLSQSFPASSESVLHIRWPKYWEFQPQHQFFQCIFRTYFL